MKVSKNAYILILIISLIVIVGISIAVAMGKVGVIWLPVCYITVYTIIKIIGPNNKPRE